MFGLSQQLTNHPPLIPFLKERVVGSLKSLKFVCLFVCLSKPIRIQHSLNQWKLINSSKKNSIYRFRGSRNSNPWSIFSNFFRLIFLHKGTVFFAKKIIFYKVLPKVIEVEESKSDVSLKRNFCVLFFETKNHFLQKYRFFIRVDRTVIGVEDSKSDISLCKLYQWKAW